jgi:putative peptidoglycan lipid II flippase
MNLLRAASTVSLLTLASRITGLIREQMVAAAFGASVMTDAFNVAFRIPNLLRRLFAEGAFSQAFVPLLAARRERDGDGPTRALIDAVATCCCGAGAVCDRRRGGGAAAGVADGAGLQKTAASTRRALTRWMFPYIGFMSLVALSAGILNTWKRFAVPAATPVLLNLSLIARRGCSRLVSATGDRADLRAGRRRVMIGGVLQLACSAGAARDWRAAALRPQPGAAARAWRTRACTACCGRWRRRCSACRWRRSRC